MIVVGCPSGYGHLATAVLGRFRFGVGKGKVMEDVGRARAEVNSAARVHPYFVDKARRVFVAAKGDPERSGALAVWAEAARRRESPPAGVCVAGDGRLLAETVRAGGGRHGFGGRGHLC